MWCGQSLGPMMSLSEEDKYQDVLMSVLGTVRRWKMGGKRQIDSDLPQSTKKLDISRNPVATFSDESVRLLE